MTKAVAIICAAVCSTAMSFAQTTVTFKPGAAVGEDATIWQLSNNCIPTGLSQTPATLNWGNQKELIFNAWTWTGASCSTGTQRVLIRFKELNSLVHPNYLTHIVSAKLRLFTPNPTEEGWGNSYYTGSPLPDPNPGWIQRVLPGNNVASSPNNWQENTVTWNSQPAVDLASLVMYVIPETSARYGFTQEVNVTALVQQIINGLYNDAYANNGFLLSLRDEIHYRGQDYASSDNPNASLWPELVITYDSLLRRPAPDEVAPAQGQQALQAPAQDDPTKAMLTAASFTQAYPGTGDATGMMITPNPSTSGWHISLAAATQVQVSVTIYDVAGKAVHTEPRNLSAGVNPIYLSGEKIPSGIYFIEVKGSGINRKGKAVKN